MDINKYGVHQTHCCALHGCKYGDDDCPVVERKIDQQYTCESCDYDGINTIDELKIVVKYMSLSNEELLVMLLNTKGKDEEIRKETLRRMNQ